MKKEKIFRLSGYAALGLVMLLGAGLIWNARATIQKKIFDQKESARPAEIALTFIAPSDCPQCGDGRMLLQTIEGQNVRILVSENFSADSEQGSKLINAYGITKLPTIVVEGEYKKENVRDAFLKFGGAEKEGALVLEANRPVYFDLAQNRAVGLVDATYIADASCKDCYDPKNHRSILEQGFGVTVNSEISVDAASREGRDLIERYAIAEIPAVILSPEAAAYSSLANAWSQVGSMETDGVFVFRRNAALGSVVYKNLKTGETIRPKTSNE